MIFCIFYLTASIFECFFLIRHLVFEVENRSQKGKKVVFFLKIIPYHCAYSSGIKVLDIDTLRLYFYKIDPHTHTWDPTRLEFHKKN